MGARLAAVIDLSVDNFDMVVVSAMQASPTAALDVVKQSRARAEAVAAAATRQHNIHQLE